MNTLKEYAEIFERLGLTELHAEEGDCKLTLRKEPAVSTPAYIQAVPATAGTVCAGGAALAGGTAAAGNAAVGNTASADNAAVGNTADSTAGAAQTRKGEAVKAPLLGIFHERGGERKLAGGDLVKKGEALCTIEAMKMMNEVTAPRDGVVAEILVTEGALVEYHQELFVLE